MTKIEKRIIRLDAAMSSVDLTDTLPEAGRKILAAYFVEVLRFSGDIAHDASAVPAMHILVRRMRHLIAALAPYYKSKKVAPFVDELDRLYSRLGAVVEAQMLLSDLQHHEHPFVSLQEIAQNRSDEALAKLTKQVQSKHFGKFAKKFTKFLTKDGRGAILPDEDTAPSEVRHLVPVLLHDAFAQLRAYEMALHAEPQQAISGLRQQLQTMRDLVASFEPLLGTSIRDFDEQLTGLLERLSLSEMLATAQHAFRDEADGEAYLDTLAAREAEMLGALPTLWEQFNTRTTLRKFSDALLVLR